VRARRQLLRHPRTSEGYRIGVVVVAVHEHDLPKARRRVGHAQVRDHLHEGVDAEGELARESPVRVGQPFPQSV
jgi:hypothetical protein